MWNHASLTIYPELRTLLEVVQSGIKPKKGPEYRYAKSVSSYRIDLVYNNCVYNDTAPEKNLDSWSINMKNITDIWEMNA